MEEGPRQAGGSPLAACAVAAVVGLLVWRAEDLAQLAADQAPWQEVAATAAEDGPAGPVRAEDDPLPEAAAQAARQPDPAAAPPGAGAAPQAAVVVAPPPEPSAPSFDVVRVARDGAALVAGRAEPGARVTLRTGGGALVRVEADAQGKFVAIFRAVPSADPRALTLDAEAEDGSVRRSSEVVMLLPEAGGGEDGSEEAEASGSKAAPSGAASRGRRVADETGVEDDGPVAGGASGPVEGGEAEAGDLPAGGAVDPEAAAEAESAPGPGTTGLAGGARAGAAEDVRPAAGGGSSPEAGLGSQPSGIAATAILRPGSVDVLPREGAGGTGLTLASISYARAGRVTLAGSGVAGTEVRAYVDDAYAQATQVAADGLWKLELGDLAAGLYRLRIDEIGSDGAVASRIETPFQRDFPPVPAEGSPEEPASVTVQPGNNLWTIARLHYGRGVLYTQIFTANRPLIRDPALIYPGQIFALPEAAEVR